MKKKMAAVATSVLVFGGLVVGVSEPARANPPMRGYIIKGLGGKCLDTADGGTAEGTPVQLYTCNGTDAQYWVVSYRGSEGDEVFIGRNGKCLDAAGGGTRDGTRVQLYTCNGTSAQIWTHEHLWLRNVGANRCLDAKDWSSADRTPLQLWSCTNGENQKWRDEPASPPDLMP